MTIRLYDYWRSSACYRVRIALNLKGLAYEAVDISLIEGAHRTPDYLAKNPQGFVPKLEVGEVRLTQSLAIIDWLDQHGIYGNRPFDSSVYDDQINWAVDGKQVTKTKTDIIKEENQP